MELGRNCHLLVVMFKKLLGPIGIRNISYEVNDPVVEIRKLEERVGLDELVL